MYLDLLLGRREIEVALAKHVDVNAQVHLLEALDVDIPGGHCKHGLVVVQGHRCDVLDVPWSLDELHLVAADLLDSNVPADRVNQLQLLVVVVFLQLLVTAVVVRNGYGFVDFTSAVDGFSMWIKVRIFNQLNLASDVLRATSTSECAESVQEVKLHHALRFELINFVLSSSFLLFLLFLILQKLLLLLHLLLLLQLLLRHPLFRIGVLRLSFTVVMCFSAVCRLASCQIGRRCLLT